MKTRRQLRESGGKRRGEKQNENDRVWARPHRYFLSIIFFFFILIYLSILFYSFTYKRYFHCILFTFLNALMHRLDSLIHSSNRSTTKAISKTVTLPTSLQLGLLWKTTQSPCVRERVCVPSAFSQTCCSKVRQPSPKGTQLWLQLLWVQTVLFTISLLNMKQFSWFCRYSQGWKSDY